MVAWGSDGNGQIDVPAGLSNLTLAASGSAFNLGLRPDGTVVGWGNNSAGQTGFVPGLTNVSALAGGLNFGAALGNQIPQTADASITGYVSHDSLITLPGFDPDGGTVGFQLLTLPLAGTLFQCADGSRGPPIENPNTTVSDPLGRLIFAPFPNQIGSPYAGFNFVATNSLYTSASAQLTMSVTLPDRPQFTFPFRDGTTNFIVGFTGSANATYSIWASTNLVDWLKIGAAAEISPARYQFADLDATNASQRFYLGTAP